MWNPFKKKIPKYITDQICPDKVEPRLCYFNDMMTCGLPISECEDCKQYINYLESKGIRRTKLPPFVLDIDKD